MANGTGGGIRATAPVTVAPPRHGLYRAPMTSLADLREARDFLPYEDWMRTLRELGDELEPMPSALKTDATEVKGCASKTWAYPTVNSDGTLHFLADSTAFIPKGTIALILIMVQDRSPKDILATDIEGELAPFGLSNQLSSNRTQGIPNMIALIRETAARYA